ncbi:MAG: hypothetical protein UH854_02615 [Clostridia bacterium]|nr:hypothetical protein [Clostridia bacterium]
MLFAPNDWSNFSYKEVKSMLEEYRSNYTMKEEDIKPTLINSDESAE